MMITVEISAPHAIRAGKSQAGKFQVELHADTLVQMTSAEREVLADAVDRSRVGQTWQEPWYGGPQVEVAAIVEPTEAAIVAWVCAIAAAEVTQVAHRAELEATRAAEWRVRTAKYIANETEHYKPERPSSAESTEDKALEARASEAYQAREEARRARAAAERARETAEREAQEAAKAATIRAEFARCASAAVLARYDAGLMSRGEVESHRESFVVRRADAVKGAVTRDFLVRAHCPISMHGDYDTCETADWREGDSVCPASPERVAEALTAIRCILPEADPDVVLVTVSSDDADEETEIFAVRFTVTSADGSIAVKRYIDLEPRS